jgi:alkylation response protein AidB-like acyl-CoA dehydrogenase
MWDLMLSDEQAMIAETVEDYLARELPLERLRPKAQRPDSAKVRAAMVELGLFGAGLPEDAGGAGLGLVEEVLIQRACGRHLVSPSVLATVLGARVAWEAGDSILASALASGQSSASLVIGTLSDAANKAVPCFVLDKDQGDLLLAWDEHGMGLFPQEALLDVRRDACLDDSVVMDSGALVLDQSSHWIPNSQAPLALRAMVLLAARMAGLAEAACEAATEYAKVREQFGKPIGSFQAVKHRCADMAMRARLCWYQTTLAALKVEALAPDMVLQAAAAKLNAAHAAHENGRAVIQVHGGIGFHAECNAHWFMKRAHIYDQAGGAMLAQARRVMAEAAATN